MLGKDRKARQNCPGISSRTGVQTDLMESRANLLETRIVKKKRVEEILAILSVGKTTSPLQTLK